VFPALCVLLWVGYFNVLMCLCVFCVWSRPFYLEPNRVLVCIGAGFWGELG